MLNAILLEELIIYHNVYTYIHLAAWIIIRASVTKHGLNISWEFQILD